MAKSNEKAKKAVGLRLDESLVEDLDAALDRVFGGAANRSWAIHQAIRDFIVRLDEARSALANTTKAATENAAKRKR
jgi:metal-responsive CopG/Arc/MetJ family transcriptional regulator